MRVLPALTFIYSISTTAWAFAPSRNAWSTGTALPAGLFDNLFKAKEQGNKVEKSIGNTGNANASIKKQLDGMMKKKKFSVLIISSSANDCIKGKNLYNGTYLMLVVVLVKIKFTSKIHTLFILVTTLRSKKKKYLMKSESSTKVRER